jgi:hypothetical protein
VIYGHFLHVKCLNKSPIGIWAFPGLRSPSSPACVWIFFGFALNSHDFEVVDPMAARRPPGSRDTLASRREMGFLVDIRHVEQS